MSKPLSEILKQKSPSASFDGSNVTKEFEKFLKSEQLETRFICMSYTDAKAIIGAWLYDISILFSHNLDSNMIELVTDWTYREIPDMTIARLGIVQRMLVMSDIDLKAWTARNLISILSRNGRVQQYARQPEKGGKIGEFQGVTMEEAEILIGRPFVNLRAVLGGKLRWHFQEQAEKLFEP